MDIQSIVTPEAGKDYPRNWNEFLDWFASEEACLTYLEGLRREDSSARAVPWCSPPIAPVGCA
jgi:hypothetical protein